MVVIQVKLHMISSVGKEGRTFIKKRYTERNGPLLKKCFCIWNIFPHGWSFPGEVRTWWIHLQYRQLRDYRWHIGSELSHREKKTPFKIRFTIFVQLKTVQCFKDSYTRTVQCFLNSDTSSEHACCSQENQLSIRCLIPISIADK